MVRKLIRFWNLVFYCMVQLQMGLHRIFNFINPVRYILNTNLVKKSFERKRGISNISEYIDDNVFKNPVTGMPIVWAGIHVNMLLISGVLIILNLIQVHNHRNFLDAIVNNETYVVMFIFLIVTPIFIFNKIIFDRKNKYLIYFKEFEKLPTRKIRLYCFECLVAYSLLIGLLIYSFTWSN